MFSRIISGPAFAMAFASSSPVRTYAAARSGPFRRENIRFRVAHGEAGADRDMEPSRALKENVRGGFTRQDFLRCDDGVDKIA